jgi:hypothetical protein
LRDFYHAAVTAWQDIAVIPQLAKHPTASVPIAHMLQPGKKSLGPDVILAELLIQAI